MLHGKCHTMGLYKIGLHRRYVRGCIHYTFSRLRLHTHIWHINCETLVAENPCTRDDYAPPHPLLYEKLAQIMCIVCVRCVVVVEQVLFLCKNKSVVRRSFVWPHLGWGYMRCINKIYRSLAHSLARENMKILSVGTNIFSFCLNTRAKCLHNLDAN